MVSLSDLLFSQSSLKDCNKSREHPVGPHKFFSATSAISSNMWSKSEAYAGFSDGNGQYLGMGSESGNVEEGWCAAGEHFRFLQPLEAKMQCVQ